MFLPSIYSLFILTSVYLSCSPDNTYDILVDDESVSSGNLLEDFTPSVNPPKEIDDLNDTKPDTWVDDPKIRDPKAEKPADWDESQPFQILDEDVRLLAFYVFDLDLNAVLLRPSNPRDGSMMRHWKSLTQMPRSLRNGMRKKMVIGFLLWCATLNVTKHQAAAFGQGQFSNPTFIRNT